MATNGNTSGDATGDFQAHDESYHRFLGWLKFGTIGSALVAALVIYLISR